ncbi:MAG: stage II sporulation protein M [Candidatus Altiarchaeota archaeon]
MVLESFVVPESWEQHPKRMLIIGFVYSTVGIFLGMWVFGKYASLAGIFLTTIPLVVVMYRAINCEEEKDLKICKEYLLMKEHMHILWFFLYLFIGIVLSYCFWFTFLPPLFISSLFNSQVETINSIGDKVTVGLAISPQEKLTVIIANNIRVWAFCILFSLIYGAGAIFILTWNASVLGVAMGDVIRRGLQDLGQYGHSSLVVKYFAVLPFGLMYLVHGLPEMASYFLGALAGGIISVAAVCHHYKSPEFWRILRDSLDLTILSFIILVLAACVEVYITPLLL